MHRERFWLLLYRYGKGMTIRSRMMITIVLSIILIIITMAVEWIGIECWTVDVICIAEESISEKILVLF